MTSYTVAYGGERLDRIAMKLLQTERQGAVEALLDANPGLVDLADAGVVPADTVITVPTDFTVAASATLALPWE